MGFVAGHLTQRFDCDGEVQWIDVDEQRRGRGIGHRLLAQLGEWFVLQNARRICVNVEANNVAARRLYEKCGARSLSESWMVWDDPTLMLAPGRNSESEERSVGG